MRYSTGMDVTYGSDSDGPALIIRGGPMGRVITPNSQWVMTTEREDGTKFWRLTSGQTLTRIQKPVAGHLSSVLSRKLSEMTPSGLHPALHAGLSNESKRLYPSITAEAEAEFKTFVSFLDDEFGINDYTWASAQPVPFVDDFGPELLIIIDGTPTVLPEIPPVYEAPHDWQRTMWWVLNNMLGPVLWNEVELIDKIIFQKISIPEDAKSTVIEGLIYYQAARAVVSGDSWQNTPDAPLLRGLINIIMKKGLRPWQNPR